MADIINKWQGSVLVFLERECYFDKKRSVLSRNYTSALKKGRREGFARTVKDTCHNCTEVSHRTLPSIAVPRQAPAQTVYCNP